MNKYQKTQDQAARKILRHTGIANNQGDREKAYKGIRKMLRAMTATMKWMDARKRKEAIDFGKMIIDYEEEKVVKVILLKDEKKTVLSEIKGE